MAQATVSRITIVHPTGRTEYEAYSPTRRDQDAALGLLVNIREGGLKVRRLTVLMSDGTTR